MTTHALLSASGAHRWMKCPGSIELSRDVPETTSVYADEGTRAHEIAARCLIDGTDADNRHVQVYLDAVRDLHDPNDILLVEQRVDLGPLDPPQAMFGTADAVIISPARRRLAVCDLKFGAGIPVEAKDNVQTRFYGLGALLGPARDQNIAAVDLVIVQPRIPHPDGPVRSETLIAPHLRAWGDELMAAAHRAVAPGAPLAPGEWCRFCRSKLICPALHEQALADAADDFATLA